MTGRFRLLQYIHKYRQALYCIPTYLQELTSLRSKRDFWQWTYFKFPNLFSLADVPTYLTVEVTNRCNLSCTHCWRAAMTRPVGDMDLSTFQKLLADVAAIRPREFKFGGSGEPSIHPRFADMMRQLRPHGLRVVVYSNGNLFRAFSFREIVRWGLDTIVVSIDGLDAISYEKMKIGSKYSELRKTLSEFREYRKSVNLRKPTLEVRHIIVPEETDLQLVRFSGDWLRLADRVSFNTIEPPDGLAPEEDVAPPKCRQIRRELAIQWDGRVPLCGGYRKEYIGNICESSIADLWRNDNLEHLRLCNEQRQFDSVPVCKRCCHCR